MRIVIKLSCFLIAQYNNSYLLCNVVNVIGVWTFSRHHQTAGFFRRILVFDFTLLEALKLRLKLEQAETCHIDQV